MDLTATEKMFMENLLMKGSPVAIRFLYTQEDVDAVEDKHCASGKMMFCQMVKQAYLEPKRIFAGPESFSCINPEIGFGFKKADRGGYEHVLPRTPKGILISPLSMCGGTPDVALFILHPEGLMRLAWLFDAAIGSMPPLSLEVRRSVCINTTVVPYLTKGFNITFLCWGARAAGDFDGSDIVFGMHAEHLEALEEFGDLIMEMESSVDEEMDEADDVKVEFKPC